MEETFELTGMGVGKPAPHLAILFLVLLLSSSNGRSLQPSSQMAE